MINKKTILITGGTGSFGQCFIKKILQKYKPKKILVFSRDEQKHFRLSNKLKKYKSKMRYFIGDVRDYERLSFAMKGADIVIHAAAMKHVPITEYNPFEAVKTNIIGSQNVINACISNKIKKVIALSTDKASSPVNLYGATKLAADKMFISANNYTVKNNDPIFSVVRYGNVMSSEGSIIPLLLNSKNKSSFNITDKKMTRFSLTLDESCEFVLSSLKNMIGGEIFVPKIPSYKLLDLTKAIIPKVKIKETGIRPGEKINEELISESEAMRTISYKNIYIILPDSEYQHQSSTYLNKYRGAKFCKKGFRYRSDENKRFLSIKELRKLVYKNN